MVLGESSSFMMLFEADPNAEGKRAVVLMHAILKPVSGAKQVAYIVEWTQEAWYKGTFFEENNEKIETTVEATVVEVSELMMYVVGIDHAQ